MSKYQTLIDALKAGPTEGPWLTKHRKGADEMYRTEVYSEEHGGIATCEWTPKNCGNGVTATYREANARLIAAANPATIRSLLADLERAEKDKERLDYIEQMSWSNPRMSGNHTWGFSKVLNGPTLRDAIDAALSQIAGGGEV